MIRNCTKTVLSDVWLACLLEWLSSLYCYAIYRPLDGSLEPSRVLFGETIHRIGVKGHFVVAHTIAALEELGPRIERLL